MTTAHRPTWKAAVGRGNEGGYGSTGIAVSHLDLASHTQLKHRAIIDKKAALKESLMKLEAAAAVHTKTTATLGRRTMNPMIEQEGRMKLLKQTEEVNVEQVKAKYDDADNDDNDSEGWSADDSSDDLDNSSDDDDGDDEDDEEALQAELAKIRAERDAQKAEQDKQRQEEEELQDQEAALVGNPLLSSASNDAGRLKRRWNDDVVFRNQAKGEPQPKKRFINDTVRNDFHKRFMDKFIK